MLFSLHMFVCFTVFFLSLISNLTALWFGKDDWYDLNFLNFTDHVHLRRKFILLLSDEMFYEYQLVIVLYVS